MRKQLAAYENDSSEEAKKRVQELRVEIKEAEESLEEQMYDKYISDQKDLLDDLYEQYETVLNKRLDDLNELVASMVEKINTNSNMISTTISEKADSVGYTLSNNMSEIWATNSENITDVITIYGQNFSEAMTTTNGVLNGISTSVAEMVSSLQSIAVGNVNNAAGSSAANSPEANTPKTESSQNQNQNQNQNKNNSTGDGVPKVGDKVKFVSGKYYGNSYGTGASGNDSLGKYVYITHINTKGTHPYHISTTKSGGSSDLGWLKLSQISGYATGKKNLLSDEVAWTQENGAEMIIRPSDGAILTPLAKGDGVLNSMASSNLWSMANNPADFIKDTLGLDNISAPVDSSGRTSVSQNFENISFVMPNVRNYEEMLAQMRTDKNFQRLIDSMGVDQLAGKSPLRKGKAIR